MYCPKEGRDWRKMSYTVVKYVSFSKKDKKIYVTGANNRVYPRTFEKFKYSSDDMTFEENIEYFFVSMLNGNYQGGQKKVREIYKKLVELKKLYAPNTTFDKDLDLKIGRDNGLDHLVSKLYAVPAIMTGKAEITQSMIELIKKYDEESITVYAETEEKYKEMGWAITGTCWSSDVFPGWNVYERRRGYGKGLLLAEKSCYENSKLGFCNTKAGRVIEVEGDLYDDFLSWTLANGWSKLSYEIREKNESIYKKMTNPELWKLFEGIEMGKLPYLDFPYEQYGFKLKEVTA